MPSPLHDYLTRPSRYDNIDGTGEMTMGAMLLGFALLGYLQSILPESSFWMRGWPSMLFMYVILAPVIGLTYWGVKAIKRHITYPRTGYVAYRRVTRSPMMLVVLFVSAAVAAVVTVCVFRFAHWEDGIIFKRSIANALLAAPYAWFVFRMGGGHRWKWLVTLFLAVGLVAISLTVHGDMIAYSRPAFLFAGIVWVASGVATLYLYLRCTQAPASETE